MTKRTALDVVADLSKATEILRQIFWVHYYRADPLDPSHIAHVIVYLEQTIVELKAYAYKRQRRRLM